MKSTQTQTPVNQNVIIQQGGLYEIGADPEGKGEILINRKRVDRTRY